MSSFVAALRRRLLTPSPASVEFARRGFPGAGRESAPALERIPKTVVAGFDAAIGDAGPALIARRLAGVDADLLGFAYEGAAMATAVRDAMGPGGGRGRALMLGPARPHLLLSYIGVGFALARLPRALWQRAVPDLTGAPEHPTLSWLVVDGYAFDLAYFDPARWITGQRRPRPHAWLGDADYFARAGDQGLGRALWFHQAGDPTGIVEEIAAFPHARRADLWSGIGLAAAFAGGADARELVALRAAAGAHAVQVGLGTVFAATARHAAGHVPESTHTAVRELAGLTVEQAVDLAAATAPPTRSLGIAAPGRPEYERWRARIRGALTAAGGRAAA